jgi:hypothetical protein
MNTDIQKYFLVQYSLNRVIAGSSGKAAIP